jgi:hypothetical protein
VRSSSTSEDTTSSTSEVKENNKKEKIYKKEIDFNEVINYKNNIVIKKLYEIVISDFVKQKFDNKSFINLYEYIITNAKQY